MTGAWDEPLGNYKLQHHPDHKTRNRSAFQYHFYSNDPDFITPKGTRFLLARTILNNDFNNDGKSDLVFIQHGPDFAPYVPRRNEILLSQPDGSYKVSYLPGTKSLFHGGASGDVDADGDVDIIATPGPKNEVILYQNNSDGTFKYVIDESGFTGVDEFTYLASDTAASDTATVKITVTTRPVAVADTFNVNEDYLSLIHI